MAGATSKHGKLEFSGKEVDFSWFMDRFEARMYLLDLHKCMNDEITTPAATPDEEQADAETRIAAEAARDVLRMKLWCELMQCLDRKSTSFLRPHKGNGTAAWKALKQHYKSSERPRIQQTLDKLTNLKMNHGEPMADYLARAEDLQMDLKEVDEALKESMLRAIILKGLPPHFASIVTVINYGVEKEFELMKQDLLNFANSQPQPASALHSSGNVQCNKCKRYGHKQAECTQAKRPECYNCGKLGHLAKECRSAPKQKCDHCQMTNHTTANCRKKGQQPGQQRQQHGQQGQGQNAYRRQGNANYANNDHDDAPDTVFSFASFGDNPEMDDTECELLIDSGCTGYMIKDRHLFTQLDDTPMGTVGNANNSRTQIMGTGTVQCWVKDATGTMRKMEFKEACYVPSYTHNLVSVKCLNDKGATVQFGTMPHMEVRGTVFPFSTNNNLFSLQVHGVGKHTAMKAESLSRWHERLGHNNKPDVTKLQPLVNGMQIHSKNDNSVCVQCVTQKAKRAAVKKEWGTRATHILDIVHTDILGPIHVESHDGFKYAIGFIDSYSRYATVYMMRSRDECFSKVQQFVADVGAPRTIVTDGAMEYLAGTLQTYLRQQGIRHQVSAPYVPEENGKIERVWGTVVGMARCMVDRASAPKTYWTNALSTAFYIKNRCLHSATGKTPFEVMYNEKPDLSNLRVFGCKAYLFIEPGARKKLDAKATEGIFLGYSTNSNTYIISVPDDNGRMRYLKSRNVTFDEDSFYFSTSDADGPPLFQTDSSQLDDSDNESMIIEVSGGHMQPQPVTEDRQAAVPHGLEQPVGNDEQSTSTIVDVSGGQREDFQAIPVRESTPEANLRQSTRVRRPPAYLEDFVTGDDDIGLSAEAHLSSVMAVPTSAKEALKDPNWRAAMDCEHKSLVENGVWDLVSLPPGQTIVSGKWHYALKYNKDGQISRYKARFVARGFTQVFGKDYSETYSPTARLSTIRTMLACAAQDRSMVYQMDIKTAYLNADIEEEVYLQQPEGFVKLGANGKPLVCKLKKSLYGLKQSGRNWHLLLSSYLEKLLFKRSINDPCLFTKVCNGTHYYVAVWVDDIIYFSKDSNFNKLFTAQMGKEFKIGDHSNLQWFLGMRISCEPGYIAIDQHQYIISMLEKFGMKDCKAVSTPLAERTVLTVADCPQPNTTQQQDMAAYDYRGLVGCLNYLATTTRPDIAYASHALSSYLNNPGHNHWMAAKHVMRYLKGTIDYKLVYNWDNTGVELTGYCDSDYAGQMDTRKSTSGYCFSLTYRGGAVSWASRLQHAVTTSTTEAEVYAAAESTKEAIHLRDILEDMGHPPSTATKLFVDNQATISLTVKDAYSTGKTKHYAVRLAYLKDRSNSQTIRLIYVPTEMNRADILTKGLGKTKTQLFTSGLLGSKRGF